MPSKTVQFKLRIPADLHGKLIASAAGKRTLTSEIQRRLWSSFDEDAVSGKVRAAVKTALRERFG